MEKRLPKWCKEAKKSMIDKDIDTQDLAIQVGCTRQFICAVVNGRQSSEMAVLKISKILEIAPPASSTYIYQ